MIMRKLSLIISSLLLFCISNSSLGQDLKAMKMEESDEAVQPMYLLKMYSGTVNLNVGFAKANFNKGVSNWKHPFGFDVSTGLGFNYLHKNNWGAEVNFSYELNYYMYKNSDVNLFLGYRAPYLDAKFKKVFSPKDDNSTYMKLGGGYMFGGSGGVGKQESNYSYTIQFVSGSSFLAMAEFGTQRRFNKSNFMDIGLVFKYGFSNIIDTDMQYIESTSPLIVQRASAITKGNYLGVTFRYYHAFKIVSQKFESRKAPDKRF